MADLRKQYIEALENSNGYDFIAKNYWEFSKEELKDIILELDYAIHCTDTNGSFDCARDVYVSASEELQERWNFDDDDEEEDEDDGRVYVPLRYL